MRLETAAALFITLTNPDRKLALTLIARNLNPKLPIVVADDSDAEVSWLPHAGASRVVLVDELVAERHGRTSWESSRPALELMLRRTIMPSMWMVDGWQMAATSTELRPKAGDSEKITINLGFVDLGQIDLLVRRASTPTAPT